MSTETITDVDALLEEILSKTKDPEADLQIDEEEVDEKDPSKLKQRKPPSEGPCKRCGQNKPLNRVMLCYPCWVKSELEDKAGWREGMAHPDWCKCEGNPDHQRLSDGN